MTWYPGFWFDLLFEGHRGQSSKRRQYWHVSLLFDLEHSNLMRERPLRKTWEYSNITKPHSQAMKDAGPWHSWTVISNQTGLPSGCQVNIKCFYAKSTINVLPTCPYDFPHQLPRSVYIKSCSHEVAKHKSGVICRFHLTVPPLATTLRKMVTQSVRMGNADVKYKSNVQVCKYERFVSSIKAPPRTSRDAMSQSLLLSTALVLAMI
jgi:hypothetical protein